MSRMFGGQRIDVFHRQYRVYSGAFVGKDNLDEGGKIILPPSALEELARLHVVYPMLFEITNTISGIKTHCGVLEFSGEEGQVYIPYWMLQHLGLEPGRIVTVKSATLPKATYTKIRPQEKAFIEISDPRAVLEKKLRFFSCLTKGDTIMITYNGRTYCIDVLEVKSKSGPCEAASIVETDMQVDFDRPADMPPSPIPEAKPQPPSFLETPEAPKAEEEEVAEPPKFIPFAGSGRRLDGKSVSVEMMSASPPSRSSSTSSLSSVGSAGSEVKGKVVIGTSTQSLKELEEQREMRRLERQKRREEKKKKEEKFPGSGRTLK